MDILLFVIWFGAIGVALSYLSIRVVKAYRESSPEWIDEITRKNFPNKG